MDNGDWSSRWGFPLYDRYRQPRSAEHPGNLSASNQHPSWLNPLDEPPDYRETYATLPATFTTAGQYPTEAPPPYSLSTGPMPFGSVSQLREAGRSPQPVRHPVVRSPRSDHLGPRTGSTPLNSESDRMTFGTKVAHSGAAPVNPQQASHETHRIPIFHHSQESAAAPSSRRHSPQRDACGPVASESSISNVSPPNSEVPQDISHRPDELGNESHTHRPPTLTADELIEKATTELNSIRLQLDGFMSTTKDKQYLCLEDKLDKLLLDIDRIDSAGDEQIRQRRRQITKDVLDAIGVLESKLNTSVEPVPSEASNPCDVAENARDSLTNVATSHDIE